MVTVYARLLSGFYRRKSNGHKHQHRIGCFPLQGYYHNRDLPKPRNLPIGYTKGKSILTVSQIISVACIQFHLPGLNFYPPMSLCHDFDPTINFVPNWTSLLSSLIDYTWHITCSLYLSNYGLNLWSENYNWRISVNLSVCISLSITGYEVASRHVFWVRIQGKCFVWYCLIEWFPFRQNHLANRRFTTILNNLSCVKL